MARSFSLSACFAIAIGRSGPRPAGFFSEYLHIFSYARSPAMGSKESNQAATGKRVGAAPTPRMRKGGACRPQDRLCDVISGPRGNHGIIVASTCLGAIEALLARCRQAVPQDDPKGVCNG